jgi:hypothetical protein
MSSNFCWLFLFLSALPCLSVYEGNHGRDVNFVHVVNPFSNHGEVPLEQQVVLDSLRLASSFAKSSSLHGINVHIVQGVLSSDEHLFSSNYPEFNLRLLSRSTATEFPKKTSKELPFISDLVDLALSFGEEQGFEKFYVILTNMDIVLNNTFYVRAFEKLNNVPAFTTCRRTVDLEVLPAKYHRNDLDHMSLHELKYTNHPGYDCFVLSNDLAKHMHLGMMFAGYPPWGILVNYFSKLFFIYIIDYLMCRQCF